MRVSHIILFAASFAWPLVAEAQRWGLAAGTMLPVGENREMSDALSMLTASVSSRSDGGRPGVRLDLGYARGGSRIVPGATADIAFITVAAVKAVPRARWAYLFGGTGAYTSRMSRAPLHVQPTTDVGVDAGAGVQVPAAKLALASVLGRLDVVVEARLHHMFTDVKPTDMVALSVGLRR